MRLENNIIIRQYGEYIYLFNAKTHKKYIFNDMAKSILERMREELTIEELLEQLSVEYAVDDTAQFIIDVSDFVNYLSQERIAVIDDSDEDYDEGVDELIGEYCKKNDQLEHIYIELTHRCNENCIHCYIHNEFTIYESEIDTGDLIKLFDDLEKLGVMQITFTGGEPFVRKDIWKILEYASRKFVINIYSNLLLIDQESVIRIKELGINKISTSIYSNIPEVHDGITKVKGSYEKTLKNLLMIKQAGIDVSVKTVVMKQNEMSFEGLIKLLHALNLEVEVSMQILAANSNDNARKNLRIMDVERYRRLVKQYENIYMDMGCECDKSERGDYICGLGRSLNIDPYGNVYPCNLLLVKLGNITNTSVIDIWNNSIKLKELRLFSKKDLESQCQKCDKFEDCLYCPGNNMHENGSMIIHNEESCLLAAAIN